jgi:hypothetical protein
VIGRGKIPVEGLETGNGEVKKSPNETESVPDLTFLPPQLQGWHIFLFVQCYFAIGIIDLIRAIVGPGKRS